MEQKKALNRKKLKVILVICIVMIVTAGIGLAVYIHHVDTVTLGKESECVQVGCIEAYCGRSAAENI